MRELKQKRKDCEDAYEAKFAQYKEKKSVIREKTQELAKIRVENVIQNDIVYHVAMKSESLDELEAELEAENAIGILKHTKISTNLSLAYPVCGKIVTEFGDRGANGEMVNCISLETRPGAIVTSPANGLVVFCGKFLNYGNMVIISNGDYRVILYGLGDMYVSVADVMEIGDYIGEMRMITKPVIKMELKKFGELLDPREWMQQTLEKEKAEKLNAGKSGNQVAR
jgi:septal ring factor EnvC (AmiA/AmiB activator)